MLKLNSVIAFLIIALKQIVMAEVCTPIEVTKITDGDTVVAKIGENNFNIRLIGIDCYETSKIHRAYRQAYEDKLSIEEVVERGKNSKMFLEKMYGNSKNSCFVFHGIDKYSRALGILYFDNLNANLELQNKGGCKIYN